MFAPIHTPRLSLRCIEPADALATSRLMTPDVSRWVASWPSPMSESMAQARITSTLEKMQQNKSLALAACEKDNNLMGWISFNRDTQSPHDAGFGYWLGTQYHGKGYMKELAPAAIELAFNILNIHRIIAAAQPENAASFAIMRHCGMTFTHEGNVFSSTRNREEWCHWYELNKSA